MHTPNCGYQADSNGYYWKCKHTEARFLFGTETALSKPGELGIPGGKMELNEDVIPCALRETEEETGIELDPARIQCMPSRCGIYHKQKMHHIFLLAYELGLYETSELEENMPDGDSTKFPLINKRFLTLPEFFASHQTKVLISEQFNQATKSWFELVDCGYFTHTSRRQTAACDQM